ncbi:class I SAM-dependent methyltransferase [uncultured Methanobacterium sp.]|uniref:class I SAM-dependent methyltransferase n=1 Tax=uncultured Methanobacterium sp. TaxID=176306 RepID=UPI002AA6B622|nr:class I SAM-dependent methyltransferase [uncultured Methanobacterium sp.]
MIHVAYDIKVYRQVLKDIIKKDDVVVELGCHVGNSTRIISQLAPKGNIIALDKGTESKEKLEQLNEEVETHIEFIQSDVRLHETLEEVAKKVNALGGCDVLSVDLGGGYHPDTTFKVFYIWSSTLKPRDTIIRNRGLLDFIHSTSTSEFIRSENGWLESCRDDGVPKRLKELKLWSPKV